MSEALTIALRFDGSEASNNRIDLYDAGQALVGFHRSLALTTHLILNDKIITQATSLQGAQIYSTPPKPGSWELIAGIVGAGWAVGSINKDSPVGNIISSAYDFVIHETLGFHVDYDKTLGLQYEEQKRRGAGNLKVLSRARFESLAEKCEPAVKEMHRPIVFSQTAKIGRFISNAGKKEHVIGNKMDGETADYISTSVLSSKPETFRGRVTSYNSQTFKGRIYLEKVGRIVGFFLREHSRTSAQILLVTNSLTANTQPSLRASKAAFVTFQCNRIDSQSGRLKSLHIDAVHAS